MSGVIKLIKIPIFGKIEDYRCMGKFEGFPPIIMQEVWVGFVIFFFMTPCISTAVATAMSVENTMSVKQWSSKTHPPLLKSVAGTYCDRNHQIEAPKPN